MQDAVSPIQYSMLIAFVVAFFSTRLLIIAHLNDSPDDPRKAHKVHKATSGGIAIMIGFAAALLYLQMNTSILPQREIYYVCGFGIGLGFLGFLDDVLTLSSKLRMGLLLMVAGGVGASYLRIEHLPIFDNIILPLGAIIGAIGTAIWILYFINAVNFMDGINGIAIGSLAVSFFSLAFLTYNHGDVSTAVLMLCLATAALGFLVYNVVQGSIFAGDTGSYFFGGTYAVLGLYAVRAGVSPLAVALCALPIIAETMLTIIHRIKLGEHILMPHNKHLYQKLARIEGAHVRVSAIWWLFSIFCGVVVNLTDIYAQKYLTIVFFIIAIAYAIGAKIARPKLRAKLENLGKA